MADKILEEWMNGTGGPQYKARLEDKPKPFSGEVQAAAYLSREQEAIQTYGFGSKPDLKEPDTELVLVRDFHHAKDVFAECRRTGICWFDVETSGFDPFEDWIVSYQISPRTGIGYYFPIAHESFEANLDDEIAMGMMADAFGWDDVLFGGHEIKFDFKWWIKRGYRLPKRWRDTIVEAFLTNENRPSLRLKDLTATILKTRTMKFEELGIAKNRHTVKAGQIPHFGFLNVMQAMTYACPDPDYSLRLDGVFYPEIEKSRYKHVFNYLDNPLVGVLSKMEMRGMGMDQVYMRSLIEPYTKRIDQSLEDLRRIADDLGFKNEPDKKGNSAPFNPGSGNQLREVVRLMGITTGKMTKGGVKGIKKVAVDKEVIKKLAPGTPFFKKLGDHRDDEKVLNAFILPLGGMEWDPKTCGYVACRGHVNPVTRRVHTSFNQTVAETGRLSSSGPNLQQVPKKSGIAVRRAFVPDRGRRFVRMDYAQIELKILAHLAKCRTMIDAFLAGKDFHSIAAIKAFNLTDVDLEGPYVYGDGIKKHPNKEHRALRDKAKAVNFGIVYGITSKGLSIQLGCSKVEAQKLIDAWFAAFPEIKDWLDKIAISGRKHGFVETMMCRARRFIRDEVGQYKFGVERQMGNHPIQGTNADLTKWSMVQIDRKIEELGRPFSTGLVCQIHDELIAECDEADVEVVVEIMKSIMEAGLSWFGSKRDPNPMTLVTGCPIDYEIQKAWMVTVEKCPNCARWDSEQVGDTSQYKCGACEAVFTP